ncbi:MAG: universal stress protein [Actinobacteria bacterium]|jgi:nucleotide-binding universal stress UspA family protein|nr:MAG: universal stress protein [Actinomycetota bacterium]
MAQKLLFAVDFSPYTEKLLGCAGELAQVGLNDVALVYVLESKKHAEIGDHKNPAYEAEMRAAEEHLGELASQLEAEGMKVTQLLKHGSPSTEIVEAAKEVDANLIFLGAHGKGFLNRAILGSVSERVLKLSDRSVMIQHCKVLKDDGGFSCENACSSLFGNILVASDFSKYADSVKPVLLDLARTLCTPITLLHVVEGKSDMGYEPLDKYKKEQAKEQMEKLEEMSYELGNYCESVRFDVVNGSTPSAILAYAKEMDASLVILGAFGGRGATADLLGSVTERVVRKSDRPVLVLKAAL